MPFYSWKCDKCNIEEETMSTLDKKKAPKCSKCKKKMRQVFNGINTSTGCLRHGYVK